MDCGKIPQENQKVSLIIFSKCQIGGVGNMLAKTKTSTRKRYPGFYPCPWHDLLTEMLKETPKTFCRKCFNAIAQRHNQLLGNALVRTEQNQRLAWDMLERFNTIELRMEAIEDAAGLENPFAEKKE